MIKQILVVFFLFFAVAIQAQYKGTIQGIVLDKEVNNEPLAFAMVAVKGTPINATTNLDGVHTLRLHPGTYTLTFNFPGYQKVEMPNIIVRKNEVTKLKNVALSALTLLSLEDSGDKEDASRLK